MNVSGVNFSSTLTKIDISTGHACNGGKWSDFRVYPKESVINEQEGDAVARNLCTPEQDLSYQANLLSQASLAILDVVLE